MSDKKWHLSYQLLLQVVRFHLNPKRWRTQWKQHHVDREQDFLHPVTLSHLHQRLHHLNSNLEVE